MSRKEEKASNNQNHESNAKTAGREALSAAVGTGVAIGAISGAGIPGLSAAGITSGLAALGAGSMLGGVFVVPALGYGAYRVSKWAFTPSKKVETE